MRKITVFLFISISVFAQDESKLDSIFFSEMLAIHHSEFQKKSSLDFHLGRLESYDEYFESLVNSKLKGTILDNFKVFSPNKKINFIYQIDSPMYLMSYASWCVPSNGELKALDKIVNENSSWMDFVLILWDSKEDAVNFSKQFHPKIKVLYVDESYKTGTKTIEILKHKLGIPISLTVSEDKFILNIRKNTQVHLSVETESAIDTIYEKINKDISLLKAYQGY